MLAHVAGGLRDASAVTILMLGCAGLSAVGSEFTTSWSGSARLRIPGNEALSVLSSVNYPAGALGEQLVCLVVSTAILCVAQGAFRLWSMSDRATAAFSGALFVLVVVSFKAHLELPAALLPINYVVAYHAHLGLGGVWMPAALGLGVVALALVASVSMERVKGVRRVLV